MGLVVELTELFGGRRPVSAELHLGMQGYLDDGQPARGVLVEEADGLVNDSCPPRTSFLRRSPGT